jgi:cation diffusion facilitator CzcD-associated flavoprotein CzcO/short-subunit dehydrogenase
MEHVDVVVIGAGLSGIGAACRIRSDVRWASLAVLEARDGIGGTWDLFRYPGIRSDSDMYTLGYSFRPWDDERAIADGESIRRYISDTADEFGVTEHIRFGHRVVSAAWSSEEARWRLQVERAGEDEPVEMTAAFVVCCTGYYRYDQGYQPELPGLEDFAGPVVHPQHWPEDLDCTGKRVVVIGSGATAITLVPALAPVAEHVTMLQRSPSYVVAMPGTGRFAGVAKVVPDRFRGSALRWSAALGSQAFYELSQRRPAMVKKMLRRGVVEQLPAGFDVDTHFSPRYDPWDQRVCLAPDGDFFAAIRDGGASVVTDHIERLTPSGIRLRSGAELEADVVVTATGLEMLFLGGMELAVDGERVEPSERLTYKGMMLDSIPNLAFTFGYTNASWTLRSDLIADYVVRLLNEMHASGTRSCQPVAPGQVGDGGSIVGLTSGYILRALDRMPKQGDRFPWQVRQSYVHDYRAMRRAPLRDEAMRFDDHPVAEVDDGFAGQVAAITGAASGIGRALAIELANRGCHLALADVDEPGLAETAGRCEGHGVKVTTAAVDVADKAAVEEWAAGVVADHGRVTLVVNNAGVNLDADVTNMAHEDLEWLMGIDFWGVVHGTTAFLPHLRRTGRGHIVNISSVFGLMSVPSQSAYNAAKFAVRGFTDALRMELEIEGSAVSATTVHPGGVKTGIVRNGRGLPETERGAADRQFQRIARTTPEQAARAILDGVARNRRRVLVGADARAIDLITRLPAGVHQRALVAAGRRSRRRPH